MNPDFLIKLGIGVAIFSGVVLLLVVVFSMWKREIKSGMEDIKKSKNTSAGNATRSDAGGIDNESEL